MNNKSADLEKMLGEIRPRRISPGLKQRIAGQLGNEQKEVVEFKVNFKPIWIGVAATLVLTAFVVMRPAGKQESNKGAVVAQNNTQKEIVSQKFKPFAANSMVIDCQDEGVYMDSEKGLVQKLKYKILDTGAILAMATPREVTMYREVTPY